MERTKLKAARLERGLSRSQLAAKIGWSQVAIGRWERGEHDPQAEAIVALCTFFCKNPVDLDLASELSEEELKMIEKILENKIVARREVWQRLLSLPAFAAIDFSALSKPLVSPEAFLSICSASIDNCRSLINHSQYAEASNTLAECMTSLSDLANHKSDYQHLAASLATQAKILQAILASHMFNYVARETRCREAVRFGELSCNESVHAMAMAWLADTYTSYCYLRPKKAIGLFRNGLSSLNEITPLNRMDLSIGLASAYALDKDTKEGQVIEMIGQARIAMPKYPETDPLYQYIGVGPSELDQLEARIYLYLAERLPDRGYAQKAYDIFERATSKRAISDRTLSKTLIRKAEAASKIGNLDEFVQCLGQGASIAIRTDSKKGQNDALIVRDKVPDKWKNEPDYKKLVQMF